MASTGTEAAPLYLRLDSSALTSGESRVAADIDDLAKQASANGYLQELCVLLQRPEVRQLLEGIFSGSPYLAGLMRNRPERLFATLSEPPEKRFVSLTMAMKEAMAAAQDQQQAMTALRVYKQDIAFLIAVADIGRVWPVMETTKRLSVAADTCLEAALEFLFADALRSGRWLQHWGPCNAEESGYFILGMGKLGALELNYSSDIDLIVFFDTHRLKLEAGDDPQSFFVRLTRDLVRLMDERSAEGYVFRTDLRLRPDPGATQAALSTDAALGYYESVGQNWERAAMMKARLVAGDRVAGEAFLKNLAPFVWRKYLDFAAIADVHAMKRQIHAFRGLGSISVAGHNVKLGRGGIREIEFFVQTQQLIAGGRQPELRVRSTLEALQRLQEREWIREEVARDLSDAYRFLRQLEHRIQMVADEQTHELPTQPDELERLARFAGYESVAALATELVPVLETVQKHYAVLFEDDEELTAAGANMVFAGEDDDPGTVEALRNMGFSQPSQVLAGVRAWHRGRSPAMRSAKSRERLTEVQPLLIKALADTADPDSAFASFDRFLTSLPAGVQLFSLLRANPGLLQLLADIMGTAPRLARVLSKRRRLLDAVLDPRTLDILPKAHELDEIIAAEFAEVTDFQDLLDRARVIGSEQIFLIGVRILTGSINARKAGEAYALVADRLIAGLQAAVEQELAESHGRMPGGEAVVIAMGKLGGREMTASSDLDLIVIYDVPENVSESEGAKPLAPSQYYGRLTQRLITALSVATAEGTLYEVDMRLRPSGNKGPVATGLRSFSEYQASEAWTWEHLALTRARVVSGSEALKTKVEAVIRDVLLRPRDKAKVAADVLEMRQRIWEQKQTASIWDFKQVRGGLVDLEFICQFLQLAHAHDHPDALDTNTLAALGKLQAAGVLAATDCERLTAAGRLLHDLGQILRLCLDEAFEPERAPEGLKELLARAGDAPSFDVVENRLREALGQVHEIFERILGRIGDAGG